MSPNLRVLSFFLFSDNDLRTGRAVQRNFGLFVPAFSDIGNEAEFVDDGIDDDEVDPEEQLLLDRKELSELGLELDNPEGFADE